MQFLITGLLGLALFYILFLFACGAILLLLPKTFLRPYAAAALDWLPPLVGGDALRDWAASVSGRIAEKRLADPRVDGIAVALAADIEAGAMRAMLPHADDAQLQRMIACPEGGQGLIGVSAPEVLAIAEYIRKNLSRGEQERIYTTAAANASRLASSTSAGESPALLECPLQNGGHLCCAYAARPVRCRILHAAIIAKESGQYLEPECPGGKRHEEVVAEGVELGLTHALGFAGLSADVYELNSALVTALNTRNAAGRWAGGEDVFRTALLAH